MKIFQIIDTLSLGGAERMAVNISNALFEEGHEAILISTRSSGNLQNYLNPGVRRYALGKGNFFDIRALLRFKRLINIHKPDVIHAHSSSIFWAVIISILSGSSARIIWHDHNGKRSNNSLFSNLPYILVSIFIDCIICVNAELLQWSVKYTFVNRKSIKFLPNFPHLNNEKDDICNENEKIKIVNIANLREPKDHLNLVKALKILLENAPNLSNKLILSLVGKKNTSTVYFKELESFIELNGLVDYINFEGETQNVEKYLYNSNIGVISSKFEGLPVSLLEYGLAGLPVVVTDVGQCAEVVGQGKYGEVVPVQNPEALAKALESLLKHQGNLKNIGMSFKEHVKKEYGAKKFLLSYYELIRI